MPAAPRQDPALGSPVDPLPGPFVHFGPGTCADPAAALRREWIVTNGLGGYATAALDGTPVRRYSGWLIAALEPPVARTVLVGGLLETATAAGRTFDLGSLERAGEGLRPAGGRHLESFTLEGMRPVWTYALGATRLEKRAWMAHGANTTYIAYRVVDGDPVDLAVTPLVTYRDHHALYPMDARRPAIAPVPDGLEVRWEGIAAVTTLLGPGATVTPQADGPADAWTRGIWHRVETERGLDDVSDLAVAGAFRVHLEPGASWTLVLTAERAADMERDGDRALAAARAWEAGLLERAAGAGADTGDPLVRQAVLAADQFVVQRSIPGESAIGRSVIAGYPWFNDWGRDTMIALPGLTLSTGRFDDAARILRSFAPWVRDGLLPNSFPDAERATPAYHSVDAPLWYVHAVEACRRATGDEALVDDVLPTVRAILDGYAGGTRFGIAMDPDDGLVRAGEPGVQLTWMDARAGDWVVTPRHGKPVEIQALWIHANRIAAAMCAARGIAAPYAGYARDAAASFATRFWAPERRHLRDVIDGPDGDSDALRPNQLFAVSLEPDLLPDDQAAAAVDAVTRALWVGCGLRSLAPDDPAYVGTYAGDRVTRDAAYHQGTAWTWLIGPWAEAQLRVGSRPAVVRARLEVFADHMRDQGLGTVGECLDGDPPHRPRACHAQAWGVAELLRALCLTATWPSDDEDRRVG